MKRSILTLLVVAILCAACENELTPNFSNMDGELIINAFLFTDRDTNYVYVSETAQNTPPPVNDATVEMRINGTLVETVDMVTPIIEMLVYSDTTITQVKKGAYRLTKRFGEGDVVRIDVYSNGRHAWAEETAPRKIQNPKADFKLANHSTYEYGEYANVTFADFAISLPDISQQAEYYRISAYADYEHSTTQWSKYGSYWKSENTDSICEELRKKYDMVVPIEFTDDYGYQEVDIYYLYNWETSCWNYGRSIDYDYGNDPILSEGEMSKTVDDDSKDQEMLLTNITNKHKVFTDHFFNNATAQIHISLELPFGNIYLPEAVYSSYDLPRLPDDYLLMSGTTYNMKLKLSIESISENQFYYLKALNVIESENYEDMSQLSGALKIPSNVNGGGGNICLTTSTVIEFNILDNYTRKRIIEEEPIYY